VKAVYQWLGFEIAFVHVGHGLLGVGVVVILAISLPWWFFLALTPLFVLSALGWYLESTLVLPIASRYLSGDPFPIDKKDED
jgi:hypothetical protein